MWTPVRLGAFIFGTLAILAIGVFLIGDKEFLFSSTYSLKSSIRTAPHLYRQADRGLGFHESRQGWVIGVPGVGSGVGRYRS